MKQLHISEGVPCKLKGIVDAEKAFWKYWEKRWPFASNNEKVLSLSGTFTNTKEAFLAGWEANGNKKKRIKTMKKQEEMSGYAKDIKGVLEDCERALQSIQTCVAYDGTICKPNQSDLCLVAIARDAIREYCRLRDKTSLRRMSAKDWHKIKGEKQENFNEIRLHDDQFCVRLSQTNDYDETKSIIVDPDSVIELAMRLLEIAGWERTEDAEVDGYIVMFFRKRKGEEND